ncbi:MAG: type II toxin-antitoxin system Phd/YefM family antitoxin [Spirochaetia bacterium]|nr:type II toxin-antitoxin system Phd/YefM family antitoxin [Spirochaetia bacterium]
MYVSTTEVQNNFGKYLKLCKIENVIITKNGKKSALLLYYPRNSDGYEAGEPFSGYGTSSKKKSNYNVTYRQFMEMTEDSENRYELIDGEVCMLASPSFTHQRVLADVNDAFRLYFKNHDTCDAFLAPLDIELIRQQIKLLREVTEDDINIVQPDLMVLCDYMKDINENDKYKGTPSLVVEILSPSTAGKDQIKKLGLYMDSGVGECWIIDPKGKKVMIYAFKEREIEDDDVFLSGARAESFIYPGLGVEVDDLFYH